MAVVVLLGLGWLCTPLGALVLDFNNIKSSADVQGAWKVMRSERGGLGAGFRCRPPLKSEISRRGAGLRSWESALGESRGLGIDSPNKLSGFSGH